MLARYKISTKNKYTFSGVKYPVKNRLFQELDSLSFSNSTRIPNFFTFYDNPYRYYFLDKRYNDMIHYLSATPNSQPESTAFYLPLQMMCVIINDLFNFSLKLGGQETK